MNAITTWEGMVLNEPLLQALEEDVRAFAESAGALDPCKLELIWIRAFKPRVKMFVGWDARLGALRTEHAYVTVCHRLYDLLMARAGAVR